MGFWVGLGCWDIVGCCGDGKKLEDEIRAAFILCIPPLIIHPVNCNQASFQNCDCSFKKFIDKRFKKFVDKRLKKFVDKRFKKFVDKRFKKFVVKRFKKFVDKRYQRKLLFINV